MNKIVPFISNTDDDLHCLQAAYMIILKYFIPDFEIEWDEWSKVTGFETDKGTWPIAGLVWFVNNGFKVTHIETFNFEMFAAEGATYLKKRYVGESGEWAIKHTNIPAEMKRAKTLAELNIFENREPAVNDIKKYIDNGHLVRAHVNSRQLNGKSGYFGHAIVVFDYDTDGFILHDPGLPALANRKVLFNDFVKAWVSPDDGTAEMDAIRLKF